MRKLTKRSAAIVTGSVLAVAGGTAAFAYATNWFSGSTTTQVTTSTIKSVTATVNLRGNADNNFYPGKAVPITNATVTNPNDFPVQITGLTNIAVTGGSCDQGKAGFELTNLTTRTFEKNSGPVTNVALGTLTMSRTADPACAGSSLTITATLAGGIAEAADTGTGTGTGTNP
ncbi:hypothetical protein Aab01nite_22500 [Paractinoplanes abujensis]|uniref:Camelysin-like metallo-endopeptidase n=1 Tax=Paractinoplanes abujensis TaxID=882441 RepID=A0A7W7CYB0_9ACTN|nr:hypothetical protein [Actinoplanes abujensis]MBB4696871.1 hypothetical protein [Actinoplanes abujensis]GID18660.1 hypothetical protein Aab01nite_22500 [Actinoplanes abujensis]